MTTLRDILAKHRRHIEQSPGAGEGAQKYALATIDDIEADCARLFVPSAAPCSTVEREVSEIIMGWHNEDEASHCRMLQAIEDLIAGRSPSPAVAESLRDKLETGLCLLANTGPEKIAEPKEFAAMQKWAEECLQLLADTSPQSTVAATAVDGWCPDCKGSGTVKGMTYGHGPDDHEIDVDCPKCKGTGAGPIPSSIAESETLQFENRDLHKVPSVYIASATGEGITHYKLCRTDADVRAFYIEMFDVEERHKEATADAMHKFADPDEWSGDQFHEELYCCSWTVRRLPAAMFVHSATTSLSRDSIIEQCAKVADVAAVGASCRPDREITEGMCRLIAKEIRALKAATDSRTKE